VTTKEWSTAEKQQWLQTEFKLHESPCLSGEGDVSRATALLLDFWDVFSLDGSYGKTDLIQHEIFTGPGAPTKTRQRPLNPTLEADLRLQIKKWADHNVIEPS
jgi:hypothetical protein